MMLRKMFRLLDNYVIARWQNRPSTALFWYLPETPLMQSQADLLRYQAARPSPFYPMDYRHKLTYPLKNRDGIIVLPYDSPIGEQVNPEAAFQYALGLHDTHQLDAFWHYVHYFHERQSSEGRWAYEFDWLGSRAPWYSALAQARGASVMLRAWLLSDEPKYLDAAKNALSAFSHPIADGGFLHVFKPSGTTYFEEYPQTPTGVINGFMATLISIWELRHFIREPWLDDLWTPHITSLEAMLPYYSTGWWSLYDLDARTPIANVNSPRYHLLEISYLQILGLLSQSPVIAAIYQKRCRQYGNILSRSRALTLKCARKLLYQ